MIEIQLNGQKKEFESELPLAKLLESLELAPSTVLVEHNGLAVLRSEYERTKISAGDRVEILRVVAGG